MQINISNDSFEIDILLGDIPYAFEQNKRNYLHIAEPWTYDLSARYIQDIKNIIDQYKINKINFICEKLFCISATILTNKLISEVYINYNLFLFSPYTTINKDVYVKRKIFELAPKNLKALWQSSHYTNNLSQEAELKSIEKKSNVNLYLFYTTESEDYQAILSQRINSSNVHHIILPIENSDIIYYFLNNKNISKNQCDFYSAMTNYKKYKFNLQSCIKDPNIFQIHIAALVKEFIEKEDRKQGIIISPKVIIKRETVSLETPVTIYGTANIRPKVQIGGFSFINSGTTVFQDTTIGRYCSIGKNCEIGAGDHPLDWLSTSPVQYGVEVQFPSYKGVCNQISTGKVTPPTIVGHDVWIGSLSLIKRGIKIGHGAVIAAGAVVTKDVPPYAIVGGVPGKILRYRFIDKIIKELLDLKWWEMDLKELHDIQFNDIEQAIEQIKARK